jgi:hypothetical protein
MAYVLKGDFMTIIISSRYGRHTWRESFFQNVPYHGLEIKASRSKSLTVSTVKHLSAAAADHCVCVNKAKQAKTLMYCFMYMVCGRMIEVQQGYLSGKEKVL